ncbi:MAG: hypothetical protein SPH31_04285 [Arcanobacterium sp.]|nr:hypothetical protein [Arcanobacterium sp.]
MAIVILGGRGEKTAIGRGVFSTLCRRRRRLHALTPLNRALKWLGGEHILAIVAITAVTLYEMRVRRRFIRNAGARLTALARIAAPSGTLLNLLSLPLSPPRLLTAAPQGWQWKRRENEHKSAAVEPSVMDRDDTTSAAILQLTGVEAVARAVSLRGLT